MTWLGMWSIIMLHKIGAQNTSGNLCNYPFWLRLLTNMVDLFDDRPCIKDKMFELPFNLRVMLCWTTRHIIRIACVAFLWYHMYFDIKYIRLKAQVIPVSFLTTTPSRPVKSHWGGVLQTHMLCVFHFFSLYVSLCDNVLIAHWSFEQKWGEARPSPTLKRKTSVLSPCCPLLPHE